MYAAYVRFMEQEVRWVDVGGNEVSQHREKVARIKSGKRRMKRLWFLLRGGTRTETDWRIHIERGYNSLIRTVHFPLQKVTYAPHDPQSTRHRLQGIPGRQPKALPVGRHVDLQA